MENVPRSTMACSHLSDTAITPVCLFRPQNEHQLHDPTSIRLWHWHSDRPCTRFRRHCDGDANQTESLTRSPSPSQVMRGSSLPDCESLLVQVNSDSESEYLARLRAAQGSVTETLCDGLQLEVQVTSKLTFMRSQVQLEGARKIQHVITEIFEDPGSFKLSAISRQRSGPSNQTRSDAAFTMPQPLTGAPNAWPWDDQLGEVLPTCDFNLKLSNTAGP
eukprot:3937544-Rhodomonas_salina.1